MDTRDIIYISIHDGHYDVGFYFVQDDKQCLTTIESGAPFTYNYNGVTFDLFNEYSNGCYSITDIFAFEQHMESLKKHYYKFDYEELCHLSVRKLFENSLNKYKKYYLYREIPRFKIIISDSFKEIQCNNKNLYQYFTEAIAENMSVFNIDDLTINLSSDVYQYYLYYGNLFDISKLDNFEPKFNHLVLEFGYSTTACYVYEFTSEMKEANMHKQIKLAKSENNVLTSCKLKSVNIYKFGLFDFISSVYSDFIKTDDDKNIQIFNSQYEYPTGLQNNLNDWFKIISYYNTSNLYSTNFENLQDDKIAVNRIDLCNTVILNNIKEKISQIIQAFNIKTYMLNSPVKVAWLIDDIETDSYIRYIELNGTSGISNLSNLYKTLINNNLIYQVISLSNIPENFENNMDKSDYLDKTTKCYGRKLNILYPDLYIKNTEETSLNSNTDENIINNYNEIYKYTTMLNQKYQDYLFAKCQFQNETKKRLIDRGYPVAKILIVLSKISMLSLNDPIIFKKYVEDFEKDPESYF